MTGTNRVKKIVVTHLYETPSSTMPAYLQSGRDIRRSRRKKHSDRDYQCNGDTKLLVNDTKTECLSQLSPTFSPTLDAPR